MKVIPASYEILTPISEKGIYELKEIERIARTCYKSENFISEDDSSARNLIRALIKSGHEAMIEHGSISVKFTVDRGVSHEIVRHRIASFAQESTRYCNYSKDKFGNELTFIRPFFFENSARMDLWKNAMQRCEDIYFDLLKTGAKPEEARSVLPNSLKTEIVMTANYREWRHFLLLRADEKAHPQMREVALPLLKELHDRIPMIFDDIWYRRRTQFVANREFIERMDESDA